jgi:hypothetical protein
VPEHIFGTHGLGLWHLDTDQSEQRGQVPGYDIHPEGHADNHLWLIELGYGYLCLFVQFRHGWISLVELQSSPPATTTIL